MFALSDVQGESHRYVYAGFGIGRSVALASLVKFSKLSLPRIVIKNDSLGGTGATTEFTSAGRLFLTDSFKGVDLTDPKRLEGGTVYFQGAGGYLFGGAGSLMLLGLNRSLLMMGIAKPDFIGMAIRSAPAALWVAGFNEGLQDAVGYSYMFGHIDYKGMYSAE
ncbi:hypothetical protein K8353_34705 [Burkholderia contaminans]|nr:hypothetical protein [Burkholderia contaminans]